MFKPQKTDNLSINIPIQSLVKAFSKINKNQETEQINFVIITQEEYEDFSNQTKTVQMNMKELQEEMQRDRSWIIQHIIKDEYFRRKIESFTQFPINDSGKYLFHRKSMLKFLDEYNDEIVERSKRTLKLSKKSFHKKRGRA
ncbi:DUF771 domain-containing protein [Staphylococcus epidermidis]|nr:DUF771 domain-containing protein [Staphylococcus epidermidis]MCG1591662.1 DUF771 domain-containing protein [Staphylococcus epidermidis]MCG2478653.1 DUF771 domain-containing protein [Staphylococcus epidermidis]